jgi:hypothetical protein
MINFDRNTWNTFEMLCLSERWSEVVLMYSGRVIWTSSFSIVRMARRFDLEAEAGASVWNIVYCGRTRLEGNTL